MIRQCSLVTVSNQRPQKWECIAYAYKAAARTTMAMLATHSGLPTNEADPFETFGPLSP